MLNLGKAQLKPRKTPVQTRSTVTVEAILEATIQVLLAVGKERLTTTRVASRAGVSVGTLYQYFPNKSALLQACLKRHMTEVSRSIERACEQNRCKGLLEMADALTDVYLASKMRDVKASSALYAIASDIDGLVISKAASARSRRAIGELFATAREGITKNPQVVADVFVAAVNGVSRRVLEANEPEQELALLRGELALLIEGYLRSCIPNEPRREGSNQPSFTRF